MRGHWNKGHNTRKVEKHQSSLSLRDLKMRSRWGGVVPKSNGTCYNKTRDERRPTSGKKGWIKAEDVVTLTELRTPDSWPQLLGQGSAPQGPVL